MVQLISKILGVVMFKQIQYNTNYMVIGEEQLSLLVTLPQLSSPTLATFKVPDRQYKVRYLRFHSRLSTSPNAFIILKLSKKTCTWIRIRDPDPFLDLAQIRDPDPPKNRGGSTPQGPGIKLNSQAEVTCKFLAQSDLI